MKSYSILIDYKEQIDDVYTLIERISDIGEVCSFGLITGASFTIQTFYGNPFSTPRHIKTGQLFANINIDRNDLDSALTNELGVHNLHNDYYCLEDMPIVPIENRYSLIKGMTYIEPFQNNKPLLEALVKTPFNTFFVRPDDKVDEKCLLSLLADHNEPFVLLGKYKYVGSKKDLEHVPYEDDVDVIETLNRGDIFYALQAKNAFRTASELISYFFSKDIFVEAFNSQCKDTRKKQDENYIQSLCEQFSDILTSEEIRSAFGKYPFEKYMRKLS